ncbi:Nif3-like dinuclear metal center hexameric protein [Novosphingobium kaempferiae]|uniref:Nif3-like dinuclear metal center hexameric protein n=1 Tax=Novosphingobium kaempferiae TaxID=2896849 RepID=UPI001E2E2B15|nr:Nif3-like dinuclear metal center hexameric protein [Novosphingobium kaempferiae]
MKVGDVLATLSQRLGWRDDTPLEGLLSGSRDTVVTGIATCAMPSVEVVRRAIAARLNVILCDGHPYYLYDPLWSSLPGTKEAIASMPEVAEKRRLIEDAGLAVVRLRSAWNAAQPASAAMSLAAALGLKASAPPTGQDFVVCDLAGEKVLQFAKRIHTTGTRLIGDPAWTISRIAVVPGMASPARLGAALRDSRVDAVIAGEVIEWEGGPYMLDVQATGRKCALMLTGLADSLDPNADAVARWARTTFAKARVEAFHGNGDFIWSIRGEIA